MDVWGRYERTRAVLGRSKRDMFVNSTRRDFTRLMMDSPASHTVQINGIEQRVLIRRTADFNVKRIIAVPGETLKHGGIVTFANNKWLITELDADNQIYEKGLMTQCNHILRWIGKDGTLKEKWCVVVDGTKLGRSPALAWRSGNVAQKRLP